MAGRYPPEFRRRVLDLIASGRKVADVAHDLGVGGQSIYKPQIVLAELHRGFSVDLIVD